MGDRVLIQMKSAESVSPVLYLHWSGSDAPAILQETRTVMAGRSTDLDYSFARLVLVACAGNPGNLSVGVFNAPQDDKGTPRELAADDSHGDAGCVVVDVSGPEWKAQCVGGYLKSRDVVFK